VGYLVFNEKKFFIFSLVIAFAIMLVFLSGCPAPAGCSSNTDCSAGQECLDSECVSMVSSECSIDSDCESGQSCVSGECLTLSACASDVDCAAEEICSFGVCAPKSAVPGECENFDFDSELANIEQQFAGGICDALPTKTTRISEMANLYIRDPKSFDINISSSYKCSTVNSVKVTAEIKYPDYLSYHVQPFNGVDYLDCTILSFSPPQGYTPDMKYCVVPLSVKIYADGEFISEEKGSVDMWFNGANSYNPNMTLPADGLDRVSCEVNLDKVCPAISGSNLCGQCSFSDISNRYAFIKNHRGECRYCSNNQTCNGGDACGEVYCAGGSSTINNSKYYVSCSQCKSNYTYYYNGYAYDTCNTLYNKCVAAGCGRILDNCR